MLSFFNILFETKTEKLKITSKHQIMVELVLSFGLTNLKDKSSLWIISGNRILSFELNDKEQWPSV